MPEPDDEIQGLATDDARLQDLSIDGQSVRFWATIAVAITGATLLVGLLLS